MHWWHYWNMVSEATCLRKTDQYFGVAIVLIFTKTTLTLTHWGRDKMATCFQTTFWNGFSWMKICGFCLAFHWRLFLMFELIIFQHWLRLWPGADQASSHHLNQWWLIYCRIYASLGLNELTHIHTCEHIKFFAIVRARCEAYRHADTDQLVLDHL